MEPYNAVPATGVETDFLDLSFHLTAESAYVGFPPDDEVLHDIFSYQLLLTVPARCDLNHLVSAAT